MAELYPDLDPSRVGYIDVAHGHRIYFEESGNPAGCPVMFLHGGPGGGTEPRQRRFFHPDRYRIVLFDQRGCGRSQPHSDLSHNTTWNLVADIEVLRTQLQIDRMVLFGGSWGSTLALAYAQAHPHRVLHMILRGIFTFADDEVAWFFESGAPALFPDAHEAFLAHLEPSARHDPISGYYRLLTSPDGAVQRAAARAWSRWECSLATLTQDPNTLRHCDDPGFSLAFSRIECHYFMHRGFFQEQTAILANMDKLDGITSDIVHGRYDVICPPRNAVRLHHRWPQSRLTVVEAAGHSAHESGIESALVEAADRFAFR